MLRFCFLSMSRLANSRSQDFGCQYIYVGCVGSFGAFVVDVIHCQWLCDCNLIFVNPHLQSTFGIRTKEAILFGMTSFISQTVLVRQFLLNVNYIEITQTQVGRFAFYFCMVAHHRIGNIGVFYFGTVLNNAGCNHRTFHFGTFSN